MPIPSYKKYICIGARGFLIHSNSIGVLQPTRFSRFLCTYFFLCGLKQPKHVSTYYVVHDFFFQIRGMTREKKLGTWFKPDYITIRLQYRGDKTSVRCKKLH